MAVMQVMTDINGNFVEEYFTPANSFGPPPPQSTILATLDFNSGGLAVFNVDAADEFRLHEQPYNPSLVIPEPRTWLLLTLGMAAIEGLRRRL
jgi:hypothetical protein